MATGIVKFFNSEKGYGFIKPDDGSPDIFVHIRSVERSGVVGLVQGMHVGFDVLSNTRTGKSEAGNLKVL